MDTPSKPGARVRSWLAGSTALLLLGLLFTFNSAIFCALWAVLTARLGATRTLRRAMHWFEGLAGAVIILFGLRVAFADAPATH